MISNGKYSFPLIKLPGLPLAFNNIEYALRICQILLKSYGAASAQILVIDQQALPKTQLEFIQTIQSSMDLSCYLVKRVSYKLKKVYQWSDQIELLMCEILEQGGGSAKPEPKAPESSLDRRIINFRNYVLEGINRIFIEYAAASSHAADSDFLEQFGVKLFEILQESTPDNIQKK